MKTLKSFVIAILIASIMMSFSVVGFAADAITIDSITFHEYVDEYGDTDASLVTVKVAFTMVSASEQVSLLLTSENISEISAETKSKIVYMSQEFTPEDGVYEFAIEKAKLASATGLEDVNGCTLYVKMGAQVVSEMATTTVTYNDPYTSKVIPGDVDGDGFVTNLDGTHLLRYLAGGDPVGDNTEAMDVDDDGEITNLDGTFLLRYLAGWDIELK